jgi:hypothetical protein
MTKLTRLRAAVIAVLSGCAAIGVAATAVGAPGSGKPDSGTAYLAIVHQSGKTLYVSGYDFDKLFGQTGVSFVATAGPGKPGTVKVTGRKVTLYTSTGTLVGTGTATEVVTATSVTIKDGKLKLTHGTGGQAGHSLTATFTGSQDTKTGILTYHYKALYT